MSAGDGADERDAPSSAEHGLLGADDEDGVQCGHDVLAAAPSTAGLHGPWYIPPNFGAYSHEHFPESSGRGSRRLMARCWYASTRSRRR